MSSHCVLSSHYIAIKWQLDDKGNQTFLGFVCRFHFIYEAKNIKQL